MLSPMRPLLLLTLCAAAFAAGCTDDDPAPQPRIEASIEDWRWAPKDDLPAAERAEEDKQEPQDELPAAAPSAAQDDEEEQPSAAERAQKAKTEPEPPPEPPKVADLPDLGGGDGDSALVKAEVLKNGIALPPLEAPPEVRAIIEAGNVIARSPYKWGGGHGKWKDTGYDCSGSVSYALAAAGLVNASMPSGGYMKWGKPGKGKWITIYTNPGHMFMVVAGVRFDTVARGQTGSRWINSMTDTSGYVARHPPGY